MTRRPAARRRPGYTLFELLVVLAVLILLAVLVIPSTESLYGNTRAKGAGDQVRGELAAARAWAMEEGRPYRVGVSEDGRKIRRAPEDEFDQPAAGEANPGARRVEFGFDRVTAKVQADGDEAPQAENGWVTAAVFLPDGTCRTAPGSNPTAAVVLTDEGKTNPALRVTVRSLTGHTRVAAQPKAGGSP